MLICASSVDADEVVDWSKLGRPSTQMSRDLGELLTERHERVVERRYVDRQELAEALQQLDRSVERAGVRAGRPPDSWLRVTEAALRVAAAADALAQAGER
jgi:hypothetical protein